MKKNQGMGVQKERRGRRQVNILGLGNQRGGLKNRGWGQEEEEV